MRIPVVSIMTSFTVQNEMKEFAHQPCRQLFAICAKSKKYHKNDLGSLTFRVQEITASISFARANERFPRQGKMVLLNEALLLGKDSGSRKQ
jgi:hypothetical protein